MTPATSSIDTDGSAAPPPSAGASLLKRIKQAVYPLSSRLLTRASLVEGPLKNSDERMRILFIHNCLFNTDLQHRSFVQPDVLRQFRVALPGVANTIRSHLADVDLVCAVLPPHCARALAPLAPMQAREEVRQVIATDRSWELMRQDFSKKRRQVSNDFSAKNGLSCRISKDPADFDLFYHRMFVPHIQRRYGALADIDSHADLRRVFDQGLLFLVISGGQPVAGALSEVVDRHLLFRRSGVLDGDESHVKVGAQTALYYFQLCHAVEQGLTALDTLKSAPFLNDGVFKHKADWGAASLQDDEAERRVFLIPGQDRRLLARFFEINPMIIDTEGGLAALIGDSSSTPMDGARAQQGVHTKGLRQLTVLSQAGSNTYPIQHEAL